MLNLIQVCGEDLFTSSFAGLETVLLRLSGTLFLFVFSYGCADFSQHALRDSQSKVKLGTEPQPNILWLVVEDMSPILSMYGDNTVSTPAIESLAEQGVTYTNVYSPSGVCAPSRAAIAMGMYPSSFGANHMRTTSNTKETGLPKYEAVPPADAKMLSQYMQELGYYTTNNLKTDYQFKAPKGAWHESGPYAHWRNRERGQPFYAVVNFTTTHESGLFEPYGIRKIEQRHYFSDDRQNIATLPQHHSVKTSTADTPVHIPMDTKFNIPPYLPDTPLVRRDMWKMYNNLVETDRQIAAVLQQLKDDGLYDDTIIVFYADHGGPLPRQKRLIYDSGLRVPMIIRYPNGKHTGSKDDQLISFVDFAPTTLDMSGADIPAHMHGRSFVDSQSQARQYIHAAADRFDGFTDVIRAVKDKRFKYIRNYRPQQGYYLPVAYREKVPTMQELLRLKQANQLSEYQAQWFRPTKVAEELFDTVNDPHELHNLIAQPKYADKVAELRNELHRWLTEIGDNPQLGEAELIAQLWQGSNKQPKTKTPVVAVEDQTLITKRNETGVSVSYQIKRNGVLSSWRALPSELAVEDGDVINVVGHRIGYLESEVISIEVN